MGSLSDDLERFLRSDGIRILVESGTVKVEPYESLTENDIDDFDSMDIENLNLDDLEYLLDRVEDLQDTLEEKEPEDEESEAHACWDDQMSKTENFIDEIRDRIDDLEDDEN